MNKKLFRSFVELLIDMAYLVILIKIFKLWGCELAVVLLFTGYVKKQLKK